MITKTQYINFHQYFAKNFAKRRDIGTLCVNHNNIFIINTKDQYFLEVLKEMEKNHIKFSKIERKPIGAITIYLSAPSKDCKKHLAYKNEQLKKVVNFG